MSKIIQKIYNRIFKNRFILPIAEFKPRNLFRYPRYFYDLAEFRLKSKLNDNAKFIILKPILGENSTSTGIDPHYFYQAVWASHGIASSKAMMHVDVGSQALFAGMLSAVTSVTFIDLRPIDVKLDNFKVIKGNILNLPFNDNEIKSISCLHVVEHVGLGRYGDEINPRGTEFACSELSRVLAAGGKLYLSVPIGLERVEFNAHRIHNPNTIIGYLRNLRLVDFSVINDDGHYIRNAEINDYTNSKYSCGLFCFTKD